MKMVSACLVGINCKWNGKSKPNKKLIKELKEGKLIPLCPEQLGGLPTPRPPCGIFGGTGKGVLTGKAQVVDTKGNSYTEPFLKGVNETLRIIKELDIKEVILRESPTCGVNRTWQALKTKDGYKNILVRGDGVLAALLRKNGIKVISERDI